MSAGEWAVREAAPHGVSPQQALTVGGALQGLTLAEVKSLFSEVPGQPAEKQGEAG